MATFSQIPPQERPFQSRIARDRILVVANATLSWSLSETAYYCSVRSIPAGNIVSYQFGSNLTTWDPGVAESSIRSYFELNVLSLMAEDADALGAQAIIFGPGVPARMKWQGVWNSVDGWQPTAIGYPSLMVMLQHYKVWPYGSTYVYTRNTSGTQYYWPVHQPGAGTPGAGIDLLEGQHYVLPGGVAADRLETISTPAPFMHDYSMLREGLVPFIGDAERNLLPPIGRVGMVSWDAGFPGGFTETQATARAIIDEATQAMGAHDRDEALQKPIVLSINSPIQSDLVGWVSMMRDWWGLNVGYYWRVAPTPTEEDYAPESQAISDYRGGSIPSNYPYYLHFGVASDSEMYNPPYITAWNPMPGAGVMLAHSYGHKYGLRAFQQGDATCSGTSQTLMTAAVQAEFMPVLYWLLRGMTWMEALYAHGYSADPMLLVAHGDPLWAPFGWPATAIPPYGGGTVGRDVDATLIELASRPHTRPVHLVKLSFGDQVQYLTDRETRSYNGHTYVGHAIEMGEVTWTPDGEQSGMLTMLNDQKAATAIILGAPAAEVACEVLISYLNEDNELAEPELLVEGVITGPTLSATDAVMPIMSDRFAVEYLPNEFFTRANGFTRLRRRGEVFIWRNEKYVIGGT